jgi:uncharacterized protein
MTNSCATKLRIRCFNGKGEIMRVLAALLMIAACLCIPCSQPRLEAEAGAVPDAESWRTELRNIRIEMRDGRHLAANVLLPEKPGRYPCILVQTPYNKDYLATEFGAPPRPGEVGRGSRRAWEQMDREHYAYAFVDWRGFHGSRDAMRGMNRRTWRRGQDGYDCVEWCAKQPWCNGKVGTWGGSALAKQQFDTAAEQPPSLVCSVPLIAFMGQRYEAYYEGGVRLEAHGAALDRIGFEVGDLATNNPLPSRLWNFVRNRSYQPEQIEVPCLIIAGWWDHFPREIIEQFEDLRARGRGKARESKLVMGPWSHTAVDVPQQGDLVFEDAADYSTRLTKKFFDYYLRGIKDSGWKETPNVHAFQCHEGWATADSWKELVGDGATYWLTGAGDVSEAQPSSHEDSKQERQFRYDPHKPTPTIGGRNLPPLSHGPADVSAIKERDDVLVYSTAELESALAVRGEISIVLQVSVNRPDVDVHVRVCDTDPDGASYLVGESIQRASLRDGRSHRLLTPGETYEVTVTLPPTAYTWREGHRLSLIISGGNHPRYERNPHTGALAWDAESAVDVDIKVLQPSKLKLPVVAEVQEPASD